MAKAYWIECKEPAPNWAYCDKCDLNISMVQDGIQYRNSNKNARHKFICQNCHDVIMYNATKWRDKHAAMLAEKEADNVN